MLRRFAVVIVGLAMLAAGIVASANPPALDANGNRAPHVSTSWPDNLNHDPAGEWAAYFDVYMASGSAIHVRWPQRAFASYADCIQTVSTDRILAVDFRAVMRVAKESFGDSTPVGLRCAPYGD